MRVTSVELHPANSSNVCVLSFRDPGHNNPYDVRAIIGLDADEITPRFYGGPGGSNKFYDLSPKAKEIVIRIRLSPRFGQVESYSSLRDNLYRLIGASRTGLIEVQFKEGLVVRAVISGFITKFETAHFDKEPEVQLTIKCNDPLLRAPTPIDVNLTGLNPASTLLQDSLSTAPHGFKFEVVFSNPAPTFTIRDPFDSSWSFSVSPTGGFLIADSLHFSSEINDKHLYIVRGAVSPIHVADKILPGSIWPIMFPGDNNLAIDNPANVIWTNIEYRPAYWGV